MNGKFGFEDLDVWNRAVDFAVKIIKIAETMEVERKHFRLLEQIEAASTSIAMNLAEGKGRYSKKEFIQFCYIARGSLYEVVTLLEIFSRNKWIATSNFQEIRQEGIEIASMIKGLIDAIRNSIDR